LFKSNLGYLVGFHSARFRAGFVRLMRDITTIYAPTAESQREVIDFLEDFVFFKPNSSF